MSHTVVIVFLPISYFRFLEGRVCVSLIIAYLAQQLSQDLTQTHLKKKKFVNGKTAVALLEPDL